MYINLICGQILVMIEQSYQQQLFTPTDGTVNVGHNDKLSASYHGTVSLFLQISLH